MKKNHYSFFTGLLTLAFLIFLFSGCGTASVVTNKSDRLKGPYKRIFIALRGDIRAANFTGPWIDKVAKELQERNVVMKEYDIPEQDDNSLSLEPESANSEINAQIKEFQPDVVMTIILQKIVAYSGVQVGRPGSNGGTFDIKLFDAGDSHTPIWRAKMKVYGDYGISLAVNKGAQNFIDKLEQDNIIAPKN